MRRSGQRRPPPPCCVLAAGPRPRPFLLLPCRRRTTFTTCGITEQPLTAPVVLDFLGQSFYNRQAVVEWLLAKKGVLADDAALYAHLNRLRQSGAALDHLTSMKDVFAVTLPAAPAAAAAPRLDAEGGDGGDPAPAHCPVTDLACDAVPFVGLAGCGHVCAERALREAGDAACGVCGEAIAPGDVVHILGSEEQVEALRALLPGRRAAKAKKAAGGKRKARPPE